MSVKDDAERIGIEVMGKLGVTQFAQVTAWSIAVSDIVAGLRTQMTAEQFELAVVVFERWGMAVPYMMHTGPPRIWMRSEVPKLKKYFEDTFKTAKRVRRKRHILPHVAENVERDELLVKEAEAFCQRTMAEMDRLVTVGDIYCESYVFHNLIEYCKDLLRVVLGDSLIEQFIAEYDTAIGSLNETTKLINAPQV